jgi:hypothetical protein
MREYAELVCIEEHVTQALGDLGKIDGHDTGSGEMNLVIVTQKPIDALAALRGLAEIPDAKPELKAAYRQVGTEDFEVLYPEGSFRFHIA